MNSKYKYRGMILVLAVFLTCGCGNADGKPQDVKTAEENAETAGETKMAESEAGQGETSGLTGESAADGHVDFTVLQKENPDIFGWLYVPGTEIDYPILQSPVSDEYYKTHTADGAGGDAGALYTEMPNMMNMCDFNTVIHGRDEAEADLFSQLHKFEDSDFFAEHEEFYIYIPDNVLTYEVFAAYFDESSDILRRYDYTTYVGCESYLQQIYSKRDMGRNVREGWEDLTPYHFLVTLDGSIRADEDRQYVVIGVLTGDAAGKIDRVILD